MQPGAAKRNGEESAEYAAEYGRKQRAEASELGCMHAVGLQCVHESRLLKPLTQPHLGGRSGPLQACR